MDTLEWVVIGVIVLSISCLGGYIYKDYQKPTIQLEKDKWICTKSVEGMHLQPVPIKGGMLMLPITTADCVEYRKN